MINRFFVLYLHHDAYSQICCSSRVEASEHLGQVVFTTGNTPLGIYDDKTELFTWEPSLLQQYNEMSLEEQARSDHQMIAIVQSLRNGLVPNSQISSLVNTQ